MDPSTGGQMPNIGPKSSRLILDNGGGQERTLPQGSALSSAFVIALLVAIGRECDLLGHTDPPGRSSETGERNDESRGDEDRRPEVRELSPCDWSHPGQTTR